MSFDGLWFHLPSVATAAISEPASTGFVRCSWKPALKAACRSSSRANAVRAAAGIDARRSRRARAACGSAHSRPRRASRCRPAARRRAARCSSSSACAADEAVSTTARQLSRCAATTWRLSSSSSTTSTRQASERLARPAPRAPGHRRADGRRFSDAENRQAHDEHRAPSALAVVSAHRAAVRLDELLDDRQPEPESGVRSRRGTVGLAERLEHVRQEISRDAVAAVG